jgi:hypothetical protein
MREASELPPYLDRRQRRQTGAEVLACGLPVLPDVLTYQMSIPVAYWKSAQCAVVLFLAFRKFDGIQAPGMTMGTYFRGGERWSPHRMWGGLGWPYDPIAKPGYLGDLDGKAIGGIGGSRTAEPEPGHWSHISAPGWCAPSRRTPMKLMRWIETTYWFR